ncbi:HNH endonuclease [Vibrio vulnificus]|uniref:HNH endonuclease n=1 Tax=Vibrio vulnificus TaxID=672 RepID=UPI00307CD580
MRCLFCKEPSHDTKGVEHLIPESFGSKKLVLPKGLVCDKCNNYFARKVERPVMSHPSMRNVRGWYQVPNKKGKIPSVLGYIAGTEIQVNMKLDKNEKLQIRAEKASEQAIVDEYLKDMQTTGEFPPFIFPVDIDPPQQEMSRFLAMLALEALALRFSYAGDQDLIIDEPSFDLIRNYARYGKGVKEWPFHRQVLFPMDTLMRHPETGEWVQVGFGRDIIITPTPETYVSFNLYGVQFTINVGGPSIHGYEMWLKDNDPLMRTGNELVKRMVNGKEQFYLEGDFSMKNGAEYDRQNLLNK